MPQKEAEACLITGCSTGIGRATAERLVRSGYTVYASARRLESIKDLEASGCRLLELDVCLEESIRRAVGTVEAECGAVSVLVNNAGYGSEGPVEEIGMDEIRRQFETNVFGLLRATQLVLPGMRRQGHGKIVNMSSMGGRLTLPGGGIYHATKYAVEAISDALRFEVRDFGIDVIVIEPGAIQSEFGRSAIERVERVANPDPAYDDFREVLKREIRGAYEGPLAVLAGEPDDVARAIERALRARRPRARYPVTLGARLLMGARRWLGDRGFDAFLRTRFKTTPRASATNDATNDRRD
ncbi:MAG: SDR family NAD(P)-dependent oxidoreductase [Deltaproteobacteria bacterium]|nr:SDR family NAD(P)-dependent oxidoreductase [Deltaproteobacteria bacterium]